MIVPEDKSNHGIVTHVDRIGRQEIVDDGQLARLLLNDFAQIGANEAGAADDQNILGR